jgi:hypothetical protein
VAFLSELLGKLERPAHDVRAERLQERAPSIEATVPGAGAQRRSRGNITSVTRNIRFDPRERGIFIESTVGDGTRRMVIKWLERQQLFRIWLGLGLILEGATYEGWCKQLRALNTEYQPLPAPENG